MDMRHITPDRLVDSTNGAALLELLELLWSGRWMWSSRSPSSRGRTSCARADPERVRRAAGLATEPPLG
ncbi:MAG: hypothetical protein IPN02_05940 [Candidatus Microthrix sp.]|uniref:Uncharacterized protein n=1 Tax=Candidatus Neomicrothrix subdominans TaxID=2954438 RepID=A0A936NAH9_9ACTN|nr:hypothetical protein [Candidatus Microthrix subdominans]